MEVFAKSELEILVPLVAELLEERRQPFGFLNVTLVKQLHPKNAELPILVTEFPMVMLVKLLQAENALLPILVTESGITILVKLLDL